MHCTVSETEQGTDLDASKQFNVLIEDLSPTLTRRLHNYAQFLRSKSQ